MGELITTLRENGEVIAQAPLAAIIWAIVIGTVLYVGLRALKANQIGDLESRLRLRNDEISNLRGKLEELEETTGAPAPVVRGQPSSPGYSDTLRQLTQLYVLSHDGISAGLLAGTELPPEDWLNGALAEQRANWRVRNIRGSVAEVYGI